MVKQGWAKLLCLMKWWRNFKTLTNDSLPLLKLGRGLTIFEDCKPSFCSNLVEVGKSFPAGQKGECLAIPTPETEILKQASSYSHWQFRWYVSDLSENSFLVASEKFYLSGPWSLLQHFTDYQKTFGSTLSTCSSPTPLFALQAACSKCAAI